MRKKQSPKNPCSVAKSVSRAVYNSASIFIGLVAAQTAISRMTVWNYLRKELKRYVFKLRPCQVLSDDNKLQRLEFAQHCQRELRNDTRYLKELFTPMNAFLLFLEY